MCKAQDTGRWQMITFKHILIPVDFGEPSARAIDLGLALVEKFSATLTLVHVCEIPVYTYAGAGITPLDLLTPIEGAARKELDRTLAAVQQKAAGATAVLRQGVTWQEILAVIKESQADLVVMGTHARRGISHVLLGSVAEKIVRMSPVP